MEAVAARRTSAGKEEVRANRIGGVWGDVALDDSREKPPIQPATVHASPGYTVVANRFE
jgi:hypothetical protein